MISVELRDLIELALGDDTGRQIAVMATVFAIVGVALLCTSRRR